MVVVLIDIKGVFDGLWWPEIFKNLNRVRVSKTIHGVLKSYLSDRTVSLAYDGDTITKEMSKGSPQGSVLGPLLWI